MTSGNGYGNGDGYGDGYGDGDGNNMEYAGIIRGYMRTFTGEIEHITLRSKQCYK